MGVMAALHFDENTPETLPTAKHEEIPERNPVPGGGAAAGTNAFPQAGAPASRGFPKSAPQDEALPISAGARETVSDEKKAAALGVSTPWTEPGNVYTEDGTTDLRGRPSIKAKSGGWRACPFILGNEACERLAYYGIGTNMVVYLGTQLHQSSSNAANNVTNWSGTCYITPLIGAFLADAYLGRFWTIAVFSAIYFIGMVLLTISASVPSLKPPKGAQAASSAQLGVFYLSLYLIALGTGGIKPCVSSFGADQFDSNDLKENRRKTSFFNWFYFSINIGALIASSVLVYIQTNVGWGWGFGIPAVAMGLAIVSFFVGSPRYRHQKPGGSPLTRIMQVFVAALKKWKVKVAKNGENLFDTHDKESGIQGSRKLDHTPAFRFLDKAATQTRSYDFMGPKPSPWQICSVTQVEEVKIILRLLPIWASTIVFSTVYAQMSTLFVEQGGLMNVSMGPNFNIPPASLSIFDTLSVIVWVPIYDRLLVPFVRRHTGNVRGFTQLQRMGIGLVISIFAMVASAVVEIERLKVGKRDNVLGNPNDIQGIPVNISIFYQIPQYFLIGASEVFTVIGQIEFFYDQAPDAMRSLCSALNLTTIALGNYLSTLIVTIVTNVTTKNGKAGWIPSNLNRGHLDYFFWTLAILSIVNLFFYLACATWFKYKRVQDSAVAPDPAQARTVGNSSG